jgi:hypothetical protein
MLEMVNLSVLHLSNEKQASLASHFFVTINIYVFFLFEQEMGSISPMDYCNDHFLHFVSIEQKMLSIFLE